MIYIRPSNFGGYTLYRIYYEDNIVYLGRTMQPLQNRIRGHLFKKPMHRAIHIELVTKIEYATFQSQADMYLYEIYYINLWKPPLNREDRASDSLTVKLPEVEWKTFTTHLWDKWKDEIKKIDEKAENDKQLKIKAFEKDRIMRAKRRAGEISEDEYWDFYNKEILNL
ncbi:MAG: GIY-YIG nuclease family protein [Bacteroidales bacterium]|nr:GIY-YIG nuclease family protein [Bacteroidales bacterium]